MGKDMDEREFAKAESNMNVVVLGYQHHQNADSMEFICTCILFSSSLDLMKP